MTVEWIEKDGLKVPASAVTRRRRVIPWADFKVMKRSILLYDQHGIGQLVWCRDCYEKSSAHATSVIRVEREELVCACTTWVVLR